MIKPLGLNSVSKQNFKAQENNVFAVFTKPKAPSPVVVEQEEKISGFQKFKTGVRNAIKTYNNTTGVMGGVLKGLIFGGLTTVGLGVIGKNLKESNNDVVKSTKGILKNIFKDFAWDRVMKKIPNLITKSPLENIKSIPKNFNFLGKEGYLKGYKGIAAISVLAGAGVFAANAVLGKIKANEANANIDHKLNTGHLKVK